MPVSDALVVGEDWISEHYFTTDAKKESFTGRVLERRAEWDDEDVSTRSRFTAGRGELEADFVKLVEQGTEVDADSGDDERLSDAPALTGEQLDRVRDLYDRVTDILGFRTGQYTCVAEGPIEFITSANLESSKPLAILAARPATTVEGLIDKHSPTLLTAWDRDEEDSIHSVSTALSTLMTQAGGPDFALVIAGRWCLIAERERWPEGRWLAVDLQLVCERNDTRRGGEIDRALTCLDAASLAPDPSGDTWWATTLEESIKHTVGVSKDLQEGVRDSIEIIAGEVVSRRRAQNLLPLPDNKAQPLAVQSLRYLYRILFLLYAEASPELQVLPVGAEEYDAGYGLNRLRDLALTELQTDRARRGTHLYDSLATLFRLVDQGHTPRGDEQLPDGLTFNALRADLFAADATALIDEVGLGNEAMLEVLRKLLLSKETAKKQRGFISYVELGINQLGAVYEGLMSYTGSFAHEDLYEVAPGGDRSGGSWVVPIAQSGHLDAKDFVQETDPDTGETRAVIHRRGSFVYRLSGRDRQRSASYYTPEVLTKFTVEQALAELLDEGDERTTADEVLRLTICEPALGSGAFAIEAVRQLAEQYLRRREKELGERIDPESRPAELQKVKAHIALHQVYGVDLNSTAVELAEVSLWLDTMAPGLQAPWFGLRLRRGNSLVGARRALYAAHRVKDKSWLKTAPEPEPLNSRWSSSATKERVSRPGSDVAGLDTASASAPAYSTSAEPVVEPVETTSIGTKIHHFLLPANGWGSAVDVPKSVRDLADPELLKRLKSWRTSIRKKPSAAQVKRLQNLAQRIEALWEFALRRLTIAEAESGRSIDLWGRDAQPDRGAVTREQIEQSLADVDGAYQRLRRVMDAWCALWYWPLTEAEVEPPTLDQWIDACRDLIGAAPDAKRAGMDTFGSATDWAELGVAEELDLNLNGAQPISRVLDKFPWLGVCQRVSHEQGFFHWELDFATVFARGGFDLQVGNPPWVRPVVDVESLLADSDPWWAVTSKASEAAKRKRRENDLAESDVVAHVLDGSTEASVLGDVLSDSTVYPVLSGQPDLYRAFMSQVWSHASSTGISALIHMESHFTDEKAATLRAESYRRLRRHWQFINELRLFDIHHLVTYSVNVYGSPRPIKFWHAVSLYHPDTVVRSFQHDGTGPEPGLKDEDGHFDQRPHRSRLQRIEESILRLWRDVLGSDSWAATPMVYTVNSAAERTLAQLAKASRVSSLELEFSAGWHERADRERGRFVSEWGKAEWRDAILQGPHLHVSTPLYKEPNSTMRNNLDWSATDFEALAADALPVTAYKPAGDRHVYDSSYTHWGEDRVPAPDFYRVAWRAMAANTGERTLISGLIPPGAAHINGVFSVGVPNRQLLDLVALQACSSTLLSDFTLRAAPKSGIYLANFSRLPLVPLDHPLLRALIGRTLRLNCATDAYADLWTECWDNESATDAPILERFDEHPIGPTWTADAPLRRAVDRRNAQVEIDALVALMLGVPVDDLCTIYRTQFAVLYGYDRREYTFDANGRLVPNSVLAVWRKKADAISEDERTAVHPGSGIAYTYELPFATRDREADFRTAYAEFERRLAAKQAST
ncbi:DNA methyltransferase [Flexivirga sp. B27]